MKFRSPSNSLRALLAGLPCMNGGSLYERILGLLKFLALLLPNLFLLLVALEFYFVVSSSHHEKNNPFIAAKERGEDWPSAGTESELRALSVRASGERMAKPTLEDEYRGHALYLLHEPESALQAYSTRYQRAVQLYSDSEPEGTAVYSPSGEVTFPGIESWGGALDAAIAIKPLISPWEDVEIRLLRLPDVAPNMSNAMAIAVGHSGQPPFARVLIADLPYDTPQDDSPYLRPYLSFKPHGVAPAGTEYFGAQEFRLNNFGFRDDDVETPKPKGLFRVVCVGASTTMEGPDNDFTYPELVQHFLKERFAGKRIEVVNAGIAGINTIGERARFADYLMMEPDAVILYNGVNDVCHIHFKTWSGEFSSWWKLLMRSNTIRTYLSPWMAPSLEKMRHAFEYGGHANLIAMAKYAKQCGVTPYICTFPHLDGPNLSEDERVYYERDARLNWTGRLFTLDTYLRAIGVWNDQLRETCAKEGVALIDLAANLTGGGQVFGDICHMKDYGIEQKARLVAVALEPQVAAFFEAQDAQALP